MAEDMGVSTLVETTSTLTAVSGPIPDPAVLAEYGKIDPSLPNRIMEMAEKQSVHRQSMEQKVIEAEILDQQDARKERSHGQRYAFVLTILIVTIAFFLAMYGHDTVASILGGGTLVALATIFITGRAFRRRKPDEKSNG